MCYATRLRPSGGAVSWCKVPVNFLGFWTDTESKRAFPPFLVPRVPLVPGDLKPPMSTRAWRGDTPDTHLQEGASNAIHPQNDARLSRCPASRSDCVRPVWDAHADENLPRGRGSQWQNREGPVPGVSKQVLCPL